MKAALTFLLFITPLFITNIYSQDHDSSSSHEFKRHRISVLYGNTIVPAAKTATDEQSVLVFPSIGINYEFWIGKKIGIGWINELEMQSYVVSHGSEAELDREFPYITSIGLFYEPFNRVAFFFGPGLELEQNESFLICKMGVEYIIPLPNNFDVAIGGSYETKNKLYDAWTFGICFGKRFGKGNSH